MGNDDSNGMGLVVAMIITYIILIVGITALVIRESGPLPFYMIIMVIIGSFFPASIIIVFLFVWFT